MDGLARKNRNGFLICSTFKTKQLAMLSERTKLSLCQYLSLHSREVLEVLFGKYDLNSAYEGGQSVLSWVKAKIFEATTDQLCSLLGEMLKTEQHLLSILDYDSYLHRPRWDDLARCLELDGYIVDNQNLVAVDPTIEGAIQVEDDLSKELSRSGLAEKDQILELLSNSAGAFRKISPDYNACLNNARVALETLAKAIAKSRQGQRPGSFDETKWGQVLAYLRTSSLITKKEEDGIGGVYSFVSPGAHSPLGSDEEEMARLGRSLVVSMIYFLVKRHQGEGRNGG